MLRRLTPSPHAPNGGIRRVDDAFRFKPPSNSAASPAARAQKQRAQSHTQTFPRVASKPEHQLKPEPASSSETRRNGEMAAQTMQCSVNGGGGGGGGESGGGGGGMRTVECLRGRLLAERVASKAAKEEAEQLAQRLDELEKKLADEVKVRNKAERRLRRAIKKLESLKILDVELSDGSIGSLSSYGRSGHQGTEVEEKKCSSSLTTDDSVPSGSGPPGGDDADGDSARASSAGSCTQVNASSQDGSWCSVVSEQSRPGPCMDLAGANSNCGSEEGAGDHDSERQQHAAPDGSAKSEESFPDDGHDDRLALVLVDPQLIAGADGSSRTRDNYDTQSAAVELHAAGTHGEEENKLAIVLVDPQPEVKAHGDVESVLLALRRVKEQLRYTIQRQSELVAHRELYGH